MARRLFSYRHQLVATPEYLQYNKPPDNPQDLLAHRLLAFSFWRPDRTWKFSNVMSDVRESVTFRPFLAMNEYNGLATALLAGAGIGDLPPIVQPELVRSGRLIEGDAELAFGIAAFLDRPPWKPAHAETCPLV